jgi:hypothetical protein
MAAERFADGQLEDDELAVARNAAAAVPVGWAIGDRMLYAYAAAETALDRASFNSQYHRGLLGQSGVGAMNDAGPRLLRDIFGPLPFRAIALDPAWLTWNHATVHAIAGRIYDERTFHDLPILADALEDAGCTDPDILAHCRQGGEHVRGCWVVDLILGKS